MENYREYMRKYVTARYHKRRAALIKRLGGKCVLCGSKTDLEFDHIDAQSKSFSICEKLAGLAEDKLEVELEKCRLLCWPCHNKKSILETWVTRQNSSHPWIANDVHERLQVL